MSHHSEISINDIRAHDGIAGINYEAQPPGAVKQATPMEIAMHTLTDEIDRTLNTMDLHAGSLVGVLGPESGDSFAVDSENPMKNNSELVQAIVKQASRVRDLRHTIEHITDRLEL